MQTETLLLIILTGIIALLLASFQYFYKKKGISKLDMLFCFLRFLSLFAVGLLIINPSLKQVKYTTEKPNLVIAIDNSRSISYLKQEQKTLNLIEKLKLSKALANKFNLDFYTFGEDLKSTDSLSFLDKQTNISKVFNQLNQIYRQSTSPTVLITDGNQTYGSDYQFAFHTYKQPIFPIISGDTITYTDLKIQQLNVNKYAYLKNRFPVEAILVYNGTEQIESEFVIQQKGATLYKKRIKLSKDNNSEVINLTLPTNYVGVSNYKALFVPLDSEKNKVNNYKNFAVEVIDEKTNIAIVGDFSHPDLGALKKSIEANEQRSVALLNSNEIISKYNDFQLLILYQPNNRFNTLFQKIKEDNKNFFLISGTKTDLRFLNRNLKELSFDITNQTENYQAELNVNFTPFIVEDLDFESFPPLNSNYGDVKFKVPYESILNKTVNGNSVNQPLLATIETNGKREVLLFGENIWQWRAHSYIENESFKAFDDFIGRLVQYVSTNKRKSRLNLDYESFYDGSGSIIIKAEFFDKNYVFDRREMLNITVVNNDSKLQKTLPLVLKNSNYQVDLGSLLPGEYSFTVSATNEKISRSGSFQILEYNVEQQFLNANVSKLRQLAANSSGSSYFIDDTENLIDDLLNDNRFIPIQKSSKNNIPLIDWKYLLAIIALSLGLEWFLRKYYGLI